MSAAVSILVERLNDRGHMLALPASPLSASSKVSLGGPDWSDQLTSQRRELRHFHTGGHSLFTGAPHW